MKRLIQNIFLNNKNYKHYFLNCDYLDNSDFYYKKYFINEKLIIKIIIL